MQGLCTFAKYIHGRHLVVWSDNTGAESAARKGAQLALHVRLLFARLRWPGCAKSFDHNDLAHALWGKAAELQLRLWVERVPTEVNIADDPSRRSLCMILGLRHCVMLLQGEI